MPIRKKAPTRQTSIWDFVDEILVVCPRCMKTALVKLDADRGHARLICSHCGHTKIKPVDQYSVGDAVDPYFHIPLRLQTSVTNHTLWAYNSSHLLFLREYIQATDRGRPPRRPADPLNKLMASRLPRWIALAKNRDRLLAALNELEKQLGE
jgi:transcription elongation factor Elf1